MRDSGEFEDFEICFRDWLSIMLSHMCLPCMCATKLRCFFFFACCLSSYTLQVGPRKTVDLCRKFCSLLWKTEILRLHNIRITVPLGASIFCVLPANTFHYIFITSRKHRARTSTEQSSRFWSARSVLRPVLMLGSLPASWQGAFLSFRCALPSINLLIQVCNSVI